jgi:TolA-binding protein
MMDDQDLLKRVGRTLRERHDGQEDTSTLTRERILASVRKQNERRSWWLKGSIPGGMLLLGTTAWAQATHQWPSVWRTIGDVFSLPLVSSEGRSEQQLATAHASQSAPRLSSRSAAAPMDNVTDVTGTAVLDAGVALDSTTEAPSNDTNAASALAAEATGDDRKDFVAQSGSRRRKPSSKAEFEASSPPQSRPTAVGAEAEIPLSEPEIAAFRSANDLDIKQHNLGSALAAYQLYVRDYPAGRFVPEARYNAAIILVKLGKRDEARRELTPFASGKYGAHRQARAVTLLEALERSDL